AEDFQRFFAHAFEFQKIPKIFFRHHERPAERAQRDALLGTTAPERQIDALDILLGFGQDPVAEIAIDLARPFLDLMRRNFLEIGGAAGALYFVDKTFGKLFGVGLNEVNKAKSDHGRTSS